MQRGDISLRDQRMCLQNAVYKPNIEVKLKEDFRKNITQTEKRSDSIEATEPST